MTELIIKLLIVAVLGFAWRWWDGRGWGIYPGQTKGKGVARLVVCAAISLGITLPMMEWGPAIVTSALMSLIWLPKQKNREEWDDMALRWAVTFLAMGMAIDLMTGNRLAIAIMGVAGVVVATLVWIGVHWRYTPWRSWLDSASITEGLSGAVGFSALVAAVSLSLL